MKLVVTICATASYCYAMKTLARRVAACVAYAEIKEPGVVVIAGDKSKEIKEAIAHFKEFMPENWEVAHIDAAKENLAEPNYKPTAQIVIAQLRSAAFTYARSIHADLCWSLDSDTLPPANALRCMMDSLTFDRGYYSIATCPYPNEAFLGGFGTPQNPIAQDFLESERVIPDELKAEIEALKKEAAESKEKEPPKEWIERKKAVDEKIKNCPPDGNVFVVNGKYGYRRRGWFEQAYPGIGRGCIVPIDWCGFGCTLMNWAALAHADFDGYDGQGTEDLFVIWHRWWPAKLRINCIPHCPCDHVIWAKKKGGDEKEFTLIKAHHEEHGECVGHLRTRKLPWREF